MTFNIFSALVMHETSLHGPTKIKLKDRLGSFANFHEVDSYHSCKQSHLYQTFCNHTVHCTYGATRKILQPCKKKRKDGFNDLMAQHHFTEDQITTYTDLRKKGKNRKAARKSRKKKLEDVDSLKKERDDKVKAVAGLRCKHVPKSLKPL